jgi:CheY-like chemotaxis protein
VNILLADDEPLLRDFLSTLLRNWGAAVTEAGSASEALRLVQTDAYDVALLDLRLGDHDALWLMRQAALPATMAVIIMSGFAPMKVVRELQQHGVSALLAKPFSPDELFDTLERCAAPALHHRITAQALPCAV